MKKNEKPTVVHIVTSLHFGGVERHMELISEELKNATMRHVFMAIGSSGATAARLMKNGAEVVTHDCPVRIPSLGALASLAKSLKKYRPLVVHTHGAEANFHGLIASWLIGVPVRIGEEIGIPQHSAIAKAVFRLVYMLAHRVIGVSAIVSKWLVNNNEIAPHKSVCMNCPTRLPRSRTSLDAELRSKFRVAFVGRLEPVKNPLALIAVAQRLAGMRVPVEVWIIGDGAQRIELENEIENHRLSNIVRVLGFQADPAPFLRRSSVCVQPSFSEGFGVSIVEAMGCGLPVVVPPIGAAPELVETGVSGWLVADNSVEALTEGLRQAWEAGPDTLFEMGQRARAVVEGRFEPTQYLSDLERMYARVAIERGIVIE
jgi:glycosyltransferase involved in cell wall biosynthesis